MAAAITCCRLGIPRSGRRGAKSYRAFKPFEERFARAVNYSRLYQPAIAVLTSVGSGKETNHADIHDHKQGTNNRAEGSA